VNLEQLDELLRRYSEAERKIAATLVDLEAQPTYKLVTSGPLRGATNARLHDALAAVPELWRAFITLRELLEKARSIRGQRRSVGDDERRQLEALLAEPSILVHVEQLPIDQRSLLGPTETETRITPEQLLIQMSATFETVTDGVGAVERAWREIVPRIDDANAALTRLEAIALTHGAAGEPALDSLRDTIRAGETMLAEDPLGIDATLTAHLDAAVAIAEERIGALARGRAGLDDDLSRASALLIDVRRQRAESAAAIAEGEVKIAEFQPIDAGSADLVDVTRGLSSELDEIRGVNDWREKRRRLDAWLARAEPIAAETARRLRANRAPIERRNELRGLLDAYRAKASDLGVIEHEGIAALLRAAHQELHTAPTALDRASRLVAQLGAALSRRPEDTR
jgi:hypothetical protein